MEEIKVSVIVPVYNVEKYIKQCLKSVFKRNRNYCSKRWNKR